MSNNTGIARHIPNIITLTNLFCGSLAIFFIFSGEWFTACLLIGIGGLADFLDGLVARALKVSSPLGAQLDSLADMISFGLAPGLMLFTIMMIPGSNTALDISQTDQKLFWLALPAFIFPMAAAVRLARFNIADDSAGDFIGMSTPSATATVIGWVLCLISDAVATSSIFPSGEFRYELYAFCILLPILMISKIGMFSLKFKGSGWRKNELRWIFISLFLILLLLNPTTAIFHIMVLYILTNTVLHLYKKWTA